MRYSASPYRVVEMFERELTDYTGAPLVATTTSCTSALLLSLRWYAENNLTQDNILIPKKTYVGVAQSILNAGFEVNFDNLPWLGAYELFPSKIWDYARWFTSGMYHKQNGFACTSFHWTKTLAIGQGGAILHNDHFAQEFFLKARFDGRTPGIAPQYDSFIRGDHCYMSPRDAAEGLSRLAVLPDHNEPLPNDDYPDLSQYPIFKSTGKTRTGLFPSMRNPNCCV